MENERRVVRVWADWHTYVEDCHFLCENSEEFSEYPISIERVIGPEAEAFEGEFLADVVIVRVPIVK